MNVEAKNRKQIGDGDWIRSNLVLAPPPSPPPSTPSTHRLHLHHKPTTTDVTFNPPPPSSPSTHRLYLHRIPHLLHLHRKPTTTTFNLR
ncbi:hypothetical protein Hanom_Chr09g00808311 [Helianthus anomalus]